MQPITAETILQKFNLFNSWKFDVITSYPMRFPPSSNKWESFQKPWPSQSLWNTGRFSIHIGELSQIVRSPTFASEMAATSEKCNSAQVDRTSQTKGLLILNNGMSSLCRFQEKINFPPCIFKLSSNKYFHFPLFVGSRYFLIKEALTLGRTRKDIPHTTTRGGGRGWNPSPEFLISCSISKRFYLRWKGFDLLNKIGYILWVVALLEACEVTIHGRHIGRHLGFYQEIEIRLKPREMVTFCALHENNP